MEEFQGQERAVILVSAVRSTETGDRAFSLGFLECPKRANVALTRAQSLLVVMADPKSMASDPTWASFLRYCVDNGCYTGCPLPEGW